jgi:DNA-binding response OmpR family regulator
MPVILVADDEWTYWKAPLTQALAGYRLIFEASPGQVVPLIQRNPEVCAVLLDLNFPGERLQGPDVLELIKRHDADIPVFILTARDETNLALKLTDKGRGPAADYFVKDDLRPDFATEVKAQAERCAADRAIANTHMVFSDRDRRVTVGVVSFVLDNRDYALYRTIAQAAKEQWTGVGPGGIGQEHKGWVAMSDFYRPSTHASRALLENYENTFGLGVARADELRKAMEENPEDIRNKISQSRSRLKTALETHLIRPKLLDKFRVHEEQRSRPVRVSTFGLMVPADQILFDVA